MRIGGGGVEGWRDGAEARRVRFKETNSIPGDKELARSSPAFIVVN